MFNPFKKKNPGESTEAASGIQPGKQAEILDKDIAIYTMPERFRFASVHASSAKKTGLIIMVAGGFLILVLALAGYFYLFGGQKKPSGNTAGNAVAEQPQTVKSVQPEQEKTAIRLAESPKDAYLRIKRESAEVNAETPAYGQIGEIIEEINGDYAMLKAATEDGTRNGVVNMAVDGGVWKISDENWITVSAIATTTPEKVLPAEIAYKPGVDMDADGLTDKEESALGTNPDLADSDGDTYPDYGEFIKMYDPAGTGRLADNVNIKKYENKTFGYSLLYPSLWPLNALKGDDSVMMKSEDDQFIQIIVQPNADRQTAGDWYKGQFGADDIGQDRLISGAAWDGVKSDDGLIVYLTDKKQDFIFTISYNPGDGDTLDYSNLFGLAVSTFEVK